jgi:aminomethyltransferase
MLGSVRRTALYDFHVRYGGKMVEFAGWSLPVQYNDFGIIDSCLHTRSKASLFDVSHMGQLTITGPDRVRFLESLIVGDVEALKEGESRLSVFTNAQGGIIDDTVVTKRAESVNVVLNAGRVDEDMEQIRMAKESFDGQVSLSLADKKSLVALQGPESASVLQHLLSSEYSLSRLPFMSAVDLDIAGHPGCTVSRSGYTGEDGFEISVPEQSDVVGLVEKIMENDAVRLAGLGARDTLRLEAGLCLYGTDLDETVSPVEAGLAWTISKSRREEGRNAFPGASKIIEQIASGVTKKRVGLTIMDGPPARHGNKLFSPANTAVSIGETTSGTFSPSLGKSIAMAYVPPDFAKVGTELFVEVRGKVNQVIVTKMPFVPSNYYRGISR